MSGRISYKNIGKIGIKPKSSLWTLEEHKKMLTFMEENYDFLIDNIKRNVNNMGRSNKAHFFVRMALHVGTKSDKQCKSRYQKKEFQMLRELNVSPSLIEAYLATKKNKNRVKKGQEKSHQSTVACNNSLKADESLIGGISSFEELRAVIIREFMPRVKTEMVRTHLQNFLKSFPIELDQGKQMPALSISPHRFYQPSFGFSIEFVQDTDNFISEGSG